MTTTWRAAPRGVLTVQLTEGDKGNEESRMSPLHLLPARYILPGKGVPCLYLFAGKGLVKVGRTINLQSREENYRQFRLAGMTCLAYITLPCADRLNEWETTLIQSFAHRFKPGKKAICKEWFKAEPGEAYELFEDVTLGLLGE